MKTTDLDLELDLLPLLTEAFVYAPQEAPQYGGYTDLIDLKDCLEAFFCGNLDDIFDLTRLWMPLHQLIPGKRLQSQLDGDTLRQCLYRLSEPHRTAIALHWESEDAELLQMMGHYFAHSQELSFGDFCDAQFTDALGLLAEIVHQAL